MLTQRQLMLVGVFIGLFILGSIAVISGLKITKEGGGDQLVVWGVYDDEEVYAGIFDAFRQNTGFEVSYVKKSPESYETELVNAIAGGSGPDIFMVGNSWLLKHSNKLLPAPAEIFTSRAIEEAYPQVVANDFTSDSLVWAVPLSVDTLALFYNRSLLDQAGIPFPPKTWEELARIAPKLVKVGQHGQIERQAVSMGKARNINRAGDIFSLLAMQGGSRMSDPEAMQAALGGAAAKALAFYIRFADRQSSVYTWSGDEHYSLDSFAEGTLGITFTYAYQLPTILAKSPRLDFRVSPMLQPVAAASRVDYANYWGFGVSRASRNARKAWELIAFLADTPQARAYMRQSGRPPARRELIREVEALPTVGVFAKQALTAVSWVQPDPAAVDMIFENMIEAAARGNRTSEDAVKDAEARMNLLFAKFR